jgi:hypothetical protein
VEFLRSLFSYPFSQFSIKFLENKRSSSTRESIAIALSSIPKKVQNKYCKSKVYFMSISFCSSFFQFRTCFRSIL